MTKNWTDCYHCCKVARNEKTSKLGVGYIVIGYEIYKQIPYKQMDGTSDEIIHDYAEYWYRQDKHEAECRYY